MKKLAVLLSAAVLVLGLAGAASASNLLFNGDFETTSHVLGLTNGIYLDELGAGQWDVYDAIPGWTSGIRDAGIEVQYSGVVVPAYSPVHYVELDSHGTNSNSSMSQDVTFDGGSLVLEFYYRPRTTTANDNGIKVYFNGAEIAWLNDYVTSSTDWQLYSYNLGAFDAGTYTLTFAANGIENTLGGFLDDISLEAVPIPGALWLLGSGLMGLVGLRRKIKA